ncbi:GNAT family N-acetyltransferase [Ornithinibacillus scapharcae]|uniref:GNAT family N-acetyltransferase n=1 Tax=Ornithinibacillus scapharcae TaxID=1147159 RepID=UPI000225BB5B|nr:GNAT family N-acetyltransferase [Ornithinibacillus scapharcae]
MEIRNLVGEEIKEAIHLSDKTFRNDNHVSMGEAFPAVFTKYHNLAYGAFDQGKLVSFFGLVPYRLKIRDAFLNVFSIGSVCTDPDYRAQGIASRILAEINDFIDQADASLLLVSGDRGLYQRNGCYPVGRSYTYNINSASPTSHIGVIREATTVDFMKIFSLYQQKEVRYESSIEEWKTLLEAAGYAGIFHLKQSVFVSEKDGKIHAYVVIGLPNAENPNRNGLVTDWGGDSEAIHTILMDILGKNIISSMKIKVPWQDNLNRFLTDYEAADNTIGGTINIVNPKRLIDQLYPYLRIIDPNVEETLIVDDVREGKIHVQYEDIQLTLTKQEFTNLIFNKDSNPISKLFPIPFPSTEGIHYV